MTERKLATVRRITDIKPIPNADRLELAIVDGWKAVVKKGEYKPGDTIVFCEIDSFLPIKPKYEFLRKSSYRVMHDGTEGFHVRTVRFRKQLSQGLILPLSSPGTYELGQDLTDDLGITKFEILVPDIAKGKSPWFVPNTDLERIQNMASTLEVLKDRSFCVTEKLDGTSFSAFNYRGEFGVCSANWELERDPSSVYWQVAGAYNLQEKLGKQNLAIQGEIVAPKVQGNKYKRQMPELYVFRVYNIDEDEFLPPDKLQSFCYIYQLQHVPFINTIVSLPDTVDEILQYAEGKSAICPTTEREGLVFVSDDGCERVSFKAVSNKFLLKE